MKKFFKNYTSAFLVAITVLFLATIVGYFTWGIDYLVAELNQVNDSQTLGNENKGFDLEGATSLDYRGISVATSTSQ